MIQHKLLSVVILLLVIVFVNLNVWASAQSTNTGSNADNMSSTMSPAKNKGLDQKTKSPDENQKEANPQLYENYQTCYATHISDVIGRTDSEMDARKTTIKKFCRGVTTSKNQKKFSECFNTQLSGGNNVDEIIKDCRLKSE